MTNGTIKITWEQKVADQIRSRFEADHAGKRDTPFMVAVSAIPGAGKSTSCQLLADMLSDIGCVLLPFDGFHIPMEELRKLPNASDAIYRRGAPDTFHADALAETLAKIRFETQEKVVKLPGFDHADGDPKQDAHEFNRDLHKIVIFEGLYLLHDENGFEEVSNKFDFSIFIDADLELCMRRLKIRNKCIPGYTPEEIDIRVDAVDRLNALTVMRSKDRADVIVQSAAVGV